ncbi:hypothetical protein BpHYR1_032598 [Brachionus plicatilis]|uniref:Uncharacterized protein n=1 Tax=Brachionus plicatilis TaxID=10195 RepID=A0A3M7QZC6_BRAPC|nr:hypothetical protein BpHYR1_032598 [Brachionus plicatilis]
MLCVKEFFYVLKLYTRARGFSNYHGRYFYVLRNKRMKKTCASKLLCNTDSMQTVDFASIALSLPSVLTSTCNNL